MSLEMKKIPLILSCCLFSIFAVAIAHSADRKPVWLEGQSTRYSEMAYLTGLGLGDEKRSAESNAVTALARIFRPEIPFPSLGQTKGRSRQKIKVVRKMDLRQDRLAPGRVVLAQVNIAEHWFDPQTKVYYALAVLNREQAAEALQRAVLEVELKATRAWKRAKGAERPQLRAKALYQALEASRQADVYQAELRVIAPNHASPLEESAMSADLQNQLNHLLQTSFQVEIALEGPYAKEVETTIFENLQQIGLTRGSEATLSVAGMIRFEKTGPKSPTWHFVRWSTRITLTEKKTGQVFGSIRRTGREGRLSQEEAEQKSLVALQSEINKTIGRTVFQFIFGE